MRRSVLILPTGTANTASVIAAFDRLGVDASFVAGPEDVDRAARVVLPGVGSFGAAMNELDRNAMTSVLLDRIEQDRPTLAICVGLHLLAEKSAESPGVGGLGVISAQIERFDPSVRVPQFGWNRVSSGDCRIVEDGWAYFANSFHLPSAPDGWRVATTEYGGSFVSALERGSLLACQFHPELSGRFGADLLARWIEGAR